MAFFSCFIFFFSSCCLYSQSLCCCPLQGFSTFVSLPQQPEGKGTSAVPDLRVDPDEQDISVSSAVSPNDAEEVDSDEAPLETRWKRLRHAGSRLPKDSRSGTVADDSGSSLPPSRTGDDAAPVQSPMPPPPSKRVRASSDFFDPDVLLTELSS